MAETTHFTQEDRKTLTELSLSSIKLETKLDRALQDIQGLSNNFADKSDHLALTKRVEGLEEDKKWLVRSILGILITTGMAALYSITH